ncbi:hypothetical protein HU200_057932 [Digitaria exilis]|uniref:HMA domain-containing protein n=1 Tax=Digitaria exilis TaxID=1010633 RepID=A0A835AAP0_9POAL|nr:hypothetical protein HU200_057932 [Digitaria exilis]
MGYWDGRLVKNATVACRVLQQKVVLLLDLQGNDVKEKRKVLKAVSTYPGLDLIAVDMKQRKLTVVGLVDPIELVTKLRKHWRAYIFYVGPATAATGAEATANQVDVPHAVVVPAKYPSYPYQPRHVLRGLRRSGSEPPQVLLRRLRGAGELPQRLRHLLTR